MPYRNFALTMLVAAAASSWSHAEGPRSASETTAALKTPEGMTVELFAAEPQITNPTNIDVDERGRLWVCDVQNYRGNQGSRPEGDRILILEDADLDGRADVVKTFYQGSDVDSALGICVLPGSPRRVIVSCSPNVWLFTDHDGDDLPDEKVALYTESGRPQHDHCVHAFVFGPEGRFYWNTGNEHDGIHDRRGEAIIDRFGRPVLPSGKPYRQGMAFRSQLDGSQFDVLAHNLRNSYELTVDAYGRIWFSDNDDDGNRGTRICLVLEGGNYGYTDELTGQSWRVARRTNQSDNVSRRHWHQNDPGSIPNVAFLDNGSPSGITIYEGQSLPTLRGRLIHCEPGRNLVRSIKLVPEGAGYQADIEPLIDGEADPWFRPVDAAVAPDGAIYIADWYDPGVGGHRQADLEHGRIYRVQTTRQAESDVAFAQPANSSTHLDRAIEELDNGCQAIRYMAWQTVASSGSEAIGPLEQLMDKGDSIARARAAWLLTRLPEEAGEAITRASRDDDPAVREAAIQMARYTGDVSVLLDLLDRLVDDRVPHVRRAVAIALRDIGMPGESTHRPLGPAPGSDESKRGGDVAGLWQRLAQQYEAGDRWMLEALGLAADGRWDAMLTTLKIDENNPASDPRIADLICGSRGSQTLSLLAQILCQNELDLGEAPRYLRAIDFQAPSDKPARLTELLTRAQALEDSRRVLITTEILERMEPSQVHGTAREALLRLLDESPPTADFARLTIRFRAKQHYPDLLQVVLNRNLDISTRVETLRFLLDQEDAHPLTDLLSQQGDQRDQLIRVLADAPHPAAGRLLWPIALNRSEDTTLRQEALRAATRERSLAERAVHAAEAGQLDDAMHTALYFALQGKPWDDLQERAAKLAPEASQTTSEQLPIDQWMTIRGDAGRGKQLYFGKANCSTCHKIGQEGKDVGPPLSGIGVKLSRTGLYEAILYPSAAISHNYPTYVALLHDGLVAKGLLVSETASQITLKNEQGVLQEFARDDVDRLERLSVSLMPTGLHRTLSPHEMADLVAYLARLDEGK